jgi:hypothetical protein
MSICSSLLVAVVVVQTLTAQVAVVALVGISPILRNRLRREM